MLINRLTDRYEEGSDGKQLRILRYGMWGTSIEIERRGRKWLVVHPNRKEKEFKRRIDAELYLKQMIYPEKEV